MNPLHNVVDNTPYNNQGISPNQYKQLLKLLSKVNINDSTRINFVLNDGAMDTLGNFLDSHGAMDTLGNFLDSHGKHVFLCVQCCYGFK